MAYLQYGAQENKAEYGHALIAKKPIMKGDGNG
jgi:hypothetical protein